MTSITYEWIAQFAVIPPNTEASVLEEVCRLFSKFLPSGQINYLMSPVTFEGEHYLKGVELIMVIYSAIFIVITNALGVFLFNKRDIK